ncbi:hypothetical protein QVD99_001790 [Batrachochytrium dendrobatidis]|nr:hypothetical protein O5D80_000402 [Batrachochytrium dendrobatidis]KAJ8331492.1 hypothetical protein O5D80_000406 [Batrachochytrium dendrobatidis]KAJ8331520.1 hypothetical protein O5D80_000433 [Batrachochytrium dendrobatidis]KAK5671934.1 hypothetical protein QVD99_001759 [Batrachochytrium dendrobatidis]KAK5671938.1 hypothetical protein QVD99_001763 [Batrachochytrium dendrobatidis]
MGTGTVHIQPDTMHHTPLHRMDLTAIKQELADSLGPFHAPAYWSLLRSFLNGRCSKQSFDMATVDMLTGVQASLHNKLILAICYNLQAGVPPPTGPPDTDFVPKNSLAFAAPIEISVTSIADSLKRPAQEELLSPMEIKKRFTTAMIMSLSSQDRQRLIGLGIVKHKDEPVLPPSKKVLFPNGFPVGIDSIPRSCKDEGDLPLMDMLEQRLRFISGIQGLGDPPTPESAKLISFALDNYLKNLLQAILRALTPLRAMRTTTASDYAPTDPLVAASLQCKPNPKKRALITTKTSKSVVNGSDLVMTNTSKSGDNAVQSMCTTTDWSASQLTDCHVKPSQCTLASTISSLEALEALHRPFGLDELRFVFDFLPQMETETLERIALEAL